MLWIAAPALACDPVVFPPHLEVAGNKPVMAEYRVWHSSVDETKGLVLEDASGKGVPARVHAVAVPPVPPEPYGWGAAYTVLKPWKKLKPGTYTLRLGDRTAAFEVRGNDKKAPPAPVGLTAQVVGRRVVIGYDAACQETAEARPMVELSFPAVQGADVYELRWKGASRSGEVPGLVVDGPGIALPATWFAESPGTVTLELSAVDAAGNRSPPASTVVVIPEL
jgi:hypothetical protein